MVLALGTFLVVFGACYSTPISMNYIIECFKSSPLEVAVIMNVYRQILALSLPFFLLPWERTVSAGWSVSLCTAPRYSYTNLMGKAFRHDGLLLRLRYDSSGSRHVERPSFTKLELGKRPNRGWSQNYWLGPVIGHLAGSAVERIAF